MRQVVLDTETTGLEAHRGHRVIEVGCVELENRRQTGRILHHYINPERDIEFDAQAVHGIDAKSLEDRPRFAQIARELRDFITGAELVIHNASFDIGFLDMEFERLGLSPTKTLCSSVLDTLAMARVIHPGQRNNLDALCNRYQVDNTRRARHGALLDAELLAEVYLSMTRGQESLLMESPADRRLPAAPSIEGPRVRMPPIVLRATEAEEAQHQTILDAIQKESGGRCQWLSLSAEADEAAAT